MTWKELWEKKWVHIAVVLIVFSCTGLTVARVGVWLSQALGFERFGFAYWMLWIFGLLPIYNVILLCYAFLFGKYRFFREKQKRSWARIKRLFGK